MLPKFSIVIPTRNRAELLQWSLKSALAQSFGNFEVVVVDNASSPETHEVVHAAKCANLHYCRTPASLSMPDNWEFAWEKARGEYVLYLCDDDALVPDALSYLHDRVLQDPKEVVIWPGASYYHPDWYGKRLRNTLMFPPYNEDCFQTIPSRGVLQHLYDFNWEHDMPKMLNSCVRKAHFDGLRTTCGRLFFPSCPDYSFAQIALYGTESFVRLSKPLFVWGASPSSIGASTAHSGEASQATRAFKKEFGAFDFFRGCPCDVPLVPNYVAGTLLAVEDSLRRRRCDLPFVINWEGYFRRMQHYLDLIPDLVIKDDYGKRLTQAMQSTLGKVIDTLGPRTDGTLTSSRLASASRILTKIINRLGPVANLELRWRHHGDLKLSQRRFYLERGVFYQNGHVIVQGETAGLKNIFDATQRLDTFNRAFFSKFPDQRTTPREQQPSLPATSSPG